MATNQLQTLEPLAKSLAATALSQSLSYCTERKFLQGIETSDNQIFHLKGQPSVFDNAISWIKILQIGKPVENSAENCFTAIQKILYSCFLPKEIQLQFLIVGEDGVTNMYLGVKTPGKALPPKSLMKNLNRFIKGIWPGIKSETVKGNDETLDVYLENLKKENYETIYSLTGIPSMESQYKTLYPATIDKLIAGMADCKHYAYLVTAEPLPSVETEAMLQSCREMNGQAESLKSMNVTEGVNSSRSHTDTTSRNISKTLSHTESFSESVSKKDFSKLGSAALATTGLGFAASMFPAAASVLNGVATTGAAIATTAVSALGGVLWSSAANVVTNLMPQKTTTKGYSDTESNTESYGESSSDSVSEGNSHSISRNLVNKHIEAVAEHLFYHSKRYESGKAIGMWSVGVYLMGDKKTDIEGGALQLRSILSGQESIFEPIRIHDVTSVLESSPELMQTTLMNFNAPTLKVVNNDGMAFEHPLGNRYSELKTILTTKELSYLINFPLSSVPGISVVDTTPGFSLNQSCVPEKSKISFGKLLYGGSPTKIPYNLDKNQLSRHTLISGINGSGKTNTVLALLNAVSKELPFLVIEPAKTEYVDWAVDYNKQHPENSITIYMPGCKSYKDKKTREQIKITPLKLNPFEIVWLSPEQDPNVLAHIDRLKSTFGAAFPMYDILPILMEDLIYTVYQKKSSDWLTQDPEFGKTLPPTLNSMSVSVDEVIGNRQYEERIERNMKACLNTRIDSLKRGWKGEMLNTIHSTPWDELFGKPCVINLSYVGDDTDKAFFMALILQFLYEYKISCAEVGRVNFNDNGCTHLTLVEEAHRVMNKCDNPEQPQYKTAQMFSNMLSEIRAYGEGMILVDQIPTRLIPDAIKNTNTKITHRLVSEDDVKAIAESMGLNKEQRLIIPRLLTGQCIVSTSLTTDKHWVLVDKSK